MTHNIGQKLNGKVLNVLKFTPSFFVKQILLGKDMNYLTIPHLNAAQKKVNCLLLFIMVLLLFQDVINCPGINL